MNSDGPVAWRLLWVILLSCLHVPEATAAAAPRNFVFFAHERERITEPAFLTNAFFAGAQLKYTWRELEPERDRYDFGGVRTDLSVLEHQGKRLFVQLQDVTFSEAVPVPKYLREDPAFSGGAARKYERGGEGATNAVFDGWVARRWDPAVRGRFAALLATLGKEFDGRIEGICLPESAIGFEEGGSQLPPGFTYAGYARGIEETLTAAKRAFPRSVVIQYANFMPGEWLPAEDRGYLRGVCAHAERIGAGLGGPDLLPHRKPQQNHALRLIAARGTSTPAGLAVQDGNLADRNPATGKPVTVEELCRFATERLRLDYLFWGTEEPYFSRDVIPYLRKVREGKP